jgi:hypothetical protein
MAFSQSAIASANLLTSECAAALQMHKLPRSGQNLLHLHFLLFCSTSTTNLQRDAEALNSFIAPVCVKDRIVITQ